MDKIKDIIGIEAYNLLLDENMSTLLHVLMSDVNTIHNITGVPLDMANKILITASEELLKNKLQTADKIEPWERISTGSECINRILLGGIAVKGISELYGYSGVGKTQFCLQLALNIQLPDKLGGKGKEVIYICTEDVFPSKRLNQLARAYRNKYNVKINFEDHIYIKHIADSIQLKRCLLNKLPFFLSTRNVGLIIIDSIAGAFRSENENPNYISRSHEFTMISIALNKLQDQYNCGILTVNQVTDNISAGVSEPCLGLAWANNITCRFCLSRHNSSPVRKFEVIFAPDLPPKFCDFNISEEGLVDV